MPDSQTQFAPTECRRKTASVNLTHGSLFSGAGGFVGAGASVMDWSIGQALQTNYSDNSGHSANGLVNGSGNPDSNAGQQSQTGASLVTGSRLRTS